MGDEVLWQSFSQLGNCFEEILFQTEVGYLKMKIKY